MAFTARSFALDARRAGLGLRGSAASFKNR
jgi:hypothetical protein